MCSRGTIQSADLKMQEQIKVFHIHISQFYLVNARPPKKCFTWGVFDKKVFPPMGPRAMAPLPHAPYHLI